MIPTIHTHVETDPLTHHEELVTEPILIPSRNWWRVVVSLLVFIVLCICLAVAYVVSY